MIKRRYEVRSLTLACDNGCVDEVVEKFYNHINNRKGGIESIIGELEGLILQTDIRDNAISRILYEEIGWCQGSFFNKLTFEMDIVYMVEYFVDENDEIIYAGLYGARISCRDKYVDHITLGGLIDV